MFQQLNKKKEMYTKKLWVAKLVSSCQTLGPGNRGVLWVSGCSRGCPDCIAESIQDIKAGTPVDVEVLANQILSWDIEGLTFSGGEPFEQAVALSALCKILHNKNRKLTFMAYSGFTLSELKESKQSGIKTLLSFLDILIDGPFISSMQGDLLWRGSFNQQIHCLSPRYLNSFNVAGPSEGVEIHVTKTGKIHWVGIPPAKGFDAQIEITLKNSGINLEN